MMTKEQNEQRAKLKAQLAAIKADPSDGGESINAPANALGLQSHVVKLPEPEGQCEYSNNWREAKGRLTITAVYPLKKDPTQFFIRGRVGDQGIQMLLSEFLGFAKKSDIVVFYTIDNVRYYRNDLFASIGPGTMELTALQ